MARWQTRRKLCLDHYGGKCACCGENTIEFLVIDHINNDGYVHRKTLHTSIFKWLIDNNFPNGFQVLCHNCNLAKSFYGKCPHKKESNDRT